METRIHLAENIYIYVAELNFFLTMYRKLSEKLHKFDVIFIKTRENITKCRVSTPFNRWNSKYIAAVVRLPVPLLSDVLSKFGYYSKKIRYQYTILILLLYVPNINSQISVFSTFPTRLHKLAKSFRSTFNSRWLLGFWLFMCVKNSHIKIIWLVKTRSIQTIHSIEELGVLKFIMMNVSDFFVSIYWSQWICIYHMHQIYLAAAAIQFMFTHICAQNAIDD